MEDSKLVNEKEQEVAKLLVEKTSTVAETDAAATESAEVEPNVGSSSRPKSGSPKNSPVSTRTKHKSSHKKTTAASETPVQEVVKVSDASVDTVAEEMAVPAEIVPENEFENEAILSKPDSKSGKSQKAKAKKAKKKVKEAEERVGKLKKKVKKAKKKEVKKSKLKTLKDKLINALKNLKKSKNKAKMAKK